MFDSTTVQQANEWKALMKNLKGQVTALEYCREKLITCTISGKVVIRDLACGDSQYSYWVTTIPEPVNCFRLHPKQLGVAASGGQSRDLEVHQVFPDRLRQSLLEASNDASSFSGGPSIGTNPGLLSTTHRIWQGKNLKIDEFGVHPPIWFSDVQFLDVDRPAQQGYKLAACTRFGEIRIYDTAKSRRPILNVQVSNHPLVKLWMGGDERELIFADTQDMIGKFDAVAGKVTAKFKLAPAGCQHFDVYVPSSNNQLLTSGENNSALNMFNAEETVNKARPVIVTGGLDTFVRIYDLQTGVLIGKIATESRISGVTILDASEAIVDNEVVELMLVKSEDEPGFTKIRANEENIHVVEPQPKRRRI